MTASPELNPTIESAKQTLKILESPGKLAWKAFRTIARFAGSVFFPYFRVWGETEIRKGPQIFVVRNYGVLTWLCALRVFKQPLRFVVADPEEKSCWFSLAESGGLTPVKLDGKLDDDFVTLEQLIAIGEKLILVIPDGENYTADMLVTELKIRYPLRVLFMAISGADEALPSGVLVPRAFPVSVFCGLPHCIAGPDDSARIELDFLERALRNLAIDELPSIFVNHPRNIGNL